MNLAWEYTAWYYDIEKIDAPVQTLNRDFINGKMSSDVMGAYTALVNAGFPKMPVLVSLQDGGRIPVDADLDKLQRDWEGEIAATRDRWPRKGPPLTPIRWTPSLFQSSCVDW